MDLWHPRAIRAPANLGGLSLLDVPPKIVLHTTETSSPYVYDPSSYYGNPYWPHSTIDPAGIHQHLPLGVGAYALYHQAGEPETNRANVVQCEIVAHASDMPDIADALLANVADWVGWVAAQTGAPLVVCPQGFHGSDEGMVLASVDSPIRFGNGDWPDWLGWSGICGHQHVGSGNDHWDPGAFPADRMLALIGGGEEDEMDADDKKVLGEIRDAVVGLGRQVGYLTAQLGVPTHDELGGDTNSGAKRLGQWADAEAAKAGIPRPTS